MDSVNISHARENNRSLSDWATNQIIQYIKENGLQEGDRIPVEAEFMERLNVSRSTVREAIRALSSRNIVAIKRGSGTFVSNSVVEDPLGLSFTQDGKKTVRELLELRIILEPHIAALCAERATEAEIKELWRLHKNVEALIESGRDHTEYDVKFHCKIAECTRNDIIITLIPEITKGVTLFITYTGEALLQMTIATHERIVRGIMARNRQEAFDAMLQHLEYNQQYIERVYTRE
jgi:DNA-binding FadR family transcriptional regulator